MKKSLFLIVLTALLCLVCALALTACEEEHAHTPATAWTTDSTDHWQVCTQSDCGAVLNKAAHTPAWSSDATRHWKDCTVCGYDTAFATHTYDAENTCVCGDYKDFRFILSSDTYIVTDYTGTATEVVIPSTYKGVAVTGIGYAAFRDCSDLTSITFPAGVTSIGILAFHGCYNLTSITIPASVTSIGGSAFGDCDSLTSVTFANPSGWWYSFYATAVSGKAIPAADLSNASTAATYLRRTYCGYYWNRT